MKLLLISLLLLSVTFGDNIDYHVTVTTASGDDDGTNGHFELYATGHGGDTVQLGVLDNTSDDVARPGNVDDYNFPGIADVGVIVCVEIKAKSNDGWRIVDISVSSKSSEKYTFVNSNNVLLSNGLFEGKDHLEMCRPKLQYVITTKTAPKDAYGHSAPGTNDRIYAKVWGNSGISTNRIRLKDSGLFADPFSAGQEDTFVVEDYFDVGDIQCVTFDIDGKDSWVIDRAEVQGPSDTLNVYTAERVMLSTDTSEASASANLCRVGGASYDVSVKTSDTKNSGSDHIFVRMEIQGAGGETTTSLLDNKPKKGELNVYHYHDLQKVGIVKCVKLTAYPDGKDMWLFDYIEVVGLYNGNVVHISNKDLVPMSSDSGEGVMELTLCK